MWNWLKKALGNSIEEKAEGFVEVNIATGEETPVKDTDEGKLWAIIAGGVCPDCGKAEGFYEGPSGGMSTNIKCAACEAGFNVTPVIGRAERI